MKKPKANKKKDSLSESIAKIETSITYYKSINDTENVKRYKKILKKMLEDMMRPKSS